MTARDHDLPPISRRQLLGTAAGAGLLAAGLGAPAAAQAPLDTANWTPDYISSIAGTIEVDTAAECAKVVPLDYKGRLTYWWVGPNEASPAIEKEIDAQFWAATTRC